jgi:tetratricopeptide (TPR) repeat protein
METNDKLDEAELMLSAALAEPGTDPPDWRIHMYLGTVGDRVGRPRARAFAEVLAAVVKAPTTEAEAPAELALSMLNEPTARRWARKLDADLVRTLLASAQNDGAPAPMVSLAAQLSILRGDAAAVGSLFAVSPAAERAAYPAIASASAVARALELVDEGNCEDALAVLAEGEVSAGEPGVASTRAFAFYGAGNLDAALDTAASAAPTFDTAAVEALVWLRRAAEERASETSDAIAEAARAASTAARIEPALGDGLLLRAQVELEGNLDISGGRRLLQTAMRKLENEPTRARLWRVQARGRDDDVFRYMTLEVAAACERPEELLRVRPDDLPFATTNYRQDASLAQLVAVALRDAGRASEAAEMFELAATFYKNSDEHDRALRARHSAMALHPTAEGLIKIAEEQWEASFRAEAQSRDAAEDELRKGIDALARLEQCRLDEEPKQRALAAYMRGLLLARRPNLGPVTVMERWLPLPWLLAAALEDRSHSYRAAYLAWALDEAMIRRPALHFAERALGLAPDDAWLQEGLIVMHVNWYGVLEPRIDELIDPMGVEAWGSTLRALDALHQDDLDRLTPLIDDITFDAFWAREIRARAIARVHGLGAAVSLYEDLLRESEKESADDFAAAEAALVLGDVDVARRHLERGISKGTIEPVGAKSMAALIDVVRGGDASVEVLREHLLTMVRPYALREWAYVRLPVLALAWAEQAQTVAAFETLNRVAEERFASLEPQPSLTAEIDIARATSTDTELDELVHRLLKLEESGSEVGTDIEERLRQLSAPEAIGANAVAPATSDTRV